MIHPLILSRLVFNGAGLRRSRRTSAVRRRMWRPLARTGRRQAIDDPTAPPAAAPRSAPLGARVRARCVAALHARVVAAAVLGGRHEEAAAACRAALEALERAGIILDADRALHEITGVPASRHEVTVTSRTNRAIAKCDAPNCAGHRVRA